MNVLLRHQSQQHQQGQRRQGLAGGDATGPVDITEVTVSAAFCQDAVTVRVQPRCGHNPRAGGRGGTLFGDGPGRAWDSTGL